jgi:carbon monoxide dehydrogenase subunit G
MDMTGSQRIEASREVVYAALNDVDILRQCIPGCETVEKTSDTEMTAKVTLKIGPVKASFSGKVTLSDLDPPNGYTITGEGSGGAAGFAKGGAKVSLEADGEATILHYTVEAQIGGKLAQLGGRLIDATSKKLAGDFFEKFSEIVGPAPEGEAAEKKKGWLGKLIGSSAAIIIAGGLLLPTCCLNGHVHAMDDVPFLICSSR